MKANKKAIFGMLTAMVMSLGVMGGVSKTSQKDVGLQQIGLGAAVVNDICCEGGSASLSYVSSTCGSASTGMALLGVNAIYFSATTPPGWAYWVVTGGVFL